jgi:hypothetical protein
MSLQNLNAGLRLVESNRSRGFFAGPRTPALVDAAEAALGGKFPASYREFLKTLGAGNFGSAEFYGVIDDNFDDSEVPNGIWLTLRERVDSKLPPALAVVGSTGDGAYYCLELSDARETPVIVYHPALPAQKQTKPEVIAPDFGTFFFQQIQAQL